MDEKNFEEMQEVREEATGKEGTGGETAGFDRTLPQKLIFAGLLLFLVLLPIPQLIQPDTDDTVISQSNILVMFAVYFLVAVVLEVYVSKVFSGKGKVPLAWWCIAALLVAGLLSMSRAKYFIIALRGNPTRSEGFLSLCGYYAIFLAASLLNKKKYRKVILLLFLGYGVFVTGMGLVQYFGIWLIVENAALMACAPLQNPNIYASFAVLFSGICMGGFLYYREDDEFTHPFPFWNRIVWFVLSLCGFAACLAALSNLIYVGMIMMFLLMLFIELVGKTKRFLPILALFLGFLAVMLLLNFLSPGKLVSKELGTLTEQIKEEGSILGESVGTDRVLIYKNSLKLLPENWLFGCGIEHYFYVYLKNFGYWQGKEGYLCDRAHNEYLNLWITEGILAIAAYLVLLFSLFVPSLARAVKNPHGEASDTFRNMLFLGFFGYIAQAFFNNAAIQVMPYFWMFCGFLLTIRDRKEE